jgi:hypothetical protein
MIQTPKEENKRENFLKFCNDQILHSTNVFVTYPRLARNIPSINLLPTLILIARRAGFGLQTIVRAARVVTYHAITGGTREKLMN